MNVPENYQVTTYALKTPPYLDIHISKSIHVVTLLVEIYTLVNQYMYMHTLQSHYSCSAIRTLPSHYNAISKVTTWNDFGVVTL